MSNIMRFRLPTNIIQEMRDSESLRDSGIVVGEIIPENSSVDWRTVPVSLPPGAFRPDALPSEVLKSIRWIVECGYPENAVGL